jgi:hypothetical protein
VYVCEQTSSETILVCDLLQLPPQVQVVLVNRPLAAAAALLLLVALILMSSSCRMDAGSCLQRTFTKRLLLLLPLLLLLLLRTLNILAAPSPCGLAAGP